MAPRYKLLVIDIDGTLLDPQGELRSASRDAVHAANAANVIVTLATGRRFLSARPIATTLGLKAPIILHNGALVKDSESGEVLYDRHLPLPLARRAISIVRNHGMQPIVYENAFDGEHLVAGPRNLDSEAARIYLARNSERLRRVSNPGAALTTDPIEIFVLDTTPRIGALARDISSSAWRTIVSHSAIRSDSRFLEVLDSHCSKGQAVSMLARQLGVEMAAVAAIGDNFNDVDMLQAVGLGIAMGNAPDQVKAAARIVVASNADDGLAEAIHRHILSSRALQ